MRSCPKCGSVKVKVGKKVGRCLNPSCGHRALESYFRGLNGSERAKGAHPSPYTAEYLKGGGIRKLPIKYD